MERRQVQLKLLLELFGILLLGKCFTRVKVSERNALRQQCCIRDHHCWLQMEDCFTLSTSARQWRLSK